MTMTHVIRSVAEPGFNPFQALNLASTYAQPNFDEARRAASAALQRRNPRLQERERDEALAQINIAHAFFKEHGWPAVKAWGLAKYGIRL